MKVKRDNLGIYLKHGDGVIRPEIPESRRELWAKNYRDSVQELMGVCIPASTNGSIYQSGDEVNKHHQAGTIQVVVSDQTGNSRRELWFIW